jgi:hypothetical protein
MLGALDWGEPSFGEARQGETLCPRLVAKIVPFFATRSVPGHSAGEPISFPTEPCGQRNPPGELPGIFMNYKFSPSIE